MSPIQSAVLRIDEREAQVEKFRAWLAKQLERAEKNLERANKKARAAGLLRAAGYQGDPDAEAINAEAYRDALLTVSDEFGALCPIEMKGESDEP